MESRDLGSAKATKSEGGVPRSPEERAKLTRKLSQPSFSSLLCLPPLTPSLTPFDSILPIGTLRPRLSLAHLPLRLGRRRKNERRNNGFGKRAEILKSWVGGEGEPVQNSGRDHKLPDRVKDGVPAKSTGKDEGSPKCQYLEIRDKPAHRRENAREGTEEER